jgi:hypothetical protein
MKSFRVAFQKFIRRLRCTKYVDAIVPTAQVVEVPVVATEPPAVETSVTEVPVETAVVDTGVIVGHQPDTMTKQSLKKIYSNVTLWYEHVNEVLAEMREENPNTTIKDALIELKRRYNEAVDEEEKEKAVEKPEEVPEKPEEVTEEPPVAVPDKTLTRVASLTLLATTVVATAVALAASTS